MSAGQAGEAGQPASSPEEVGKPTLTLVCGHSPSTWARGPFHTLTEPPPAPLHPPGWFPTHGPRCTHSPGLLSRSFHPEVLAHGRPELLSPRDEVLLQAADQRG